MLVFTCSSCGAKLQMGEELAGKKVRCSSCQAVITAASVDEAAAIQAVPGAPTPGSFQKSAPAEEPPARDQDDADADIRRRGPRRDAGGTTGAAVGAGIGAGAIVLIVLGVGACLIIPCMIALLVPAVQKVREAAARTQAQNNMKQIALAAHAHHDQFKALPTPKALDPQTGQEVNLSWRVSILPFIEQDALFRQFDKSKAWDSPQNSGLSNMTILTYTDPMLPPGPKAVTPYQYFTGPETLWPDNSKRKMQDITDGTSNTFLFGQSANQVPWAQPVDMAIQQGKALPLPQDRVLVAMADGSVRVIERNRVQDATLMRWMNPNSGQPRPPID